MDTLYNKQRLLDKKLLGGYSSHLVIPLVRVWSVNTGTEMLKVVVIVVKPFCLQTSKRTKYENRSIYMYKLDLACSYVSMFR